MTPIWSPEAIEDLAAIRAHVANENRSAAQRIVHRIFETVEGLLSENADLGRPGRVPGTRELVISGTPFIVPYRVDGDAIQVLRVLHGARRWPDHF
jgi:toxin ParE1/3/4